MLWFIWIKYPQYIGIDSEYDRTQIPFKVTSGLVIFASLISAPILHLIYPVEFGFDQAIGLTAMVAGVILQGLARKELGRYYLAKLCIMPGQKLVKTGVYRLMKHPGYISCLMFLVGSAMALGDLILLTLTYVYGVLLLHRIKVENLMLKELLSNEERQG